MALRTAREACFVFMTRGRQEWDPCIRVSIVVQSTDSISSRCILCNRKRTSLCVSRAKGVSEADQVIDVRRVWCTEETFRMRHFVLPASSRDGMRPSCSNRASRPSAHRFERVRNPHEHLVLIQHFQRRFGICLQIFRCDAFRGSGSACPEYRRKVIFSGETRTSLNPDSSVPFSIHTSRTWYRCDPTVALSQLAVPARSKFCGESGTDPRSVRRRLAGHTAGGGGLRRVPDEKTSIQVRNRRHARCRPPVRSHVTDRRPNQSAADAMTRARECTVTCNCR